jgi:hypothetical protein
MVVILRFGKPISLGEIRAKKKAGALEEDVRGQMSEVRKRGHDVFRV